VTLHLLNSPPVKNGIKNLTGCISFAGAALILCQMPSTWKTTDKTALFLQTSVLLNGIARRPGLAICEWIVHQIATPETLTKIFGQNRVFEIYP
jgi:hypothetical protein